MGGGELRRRLGPAKVHQYFAAPQGKHNRVVVRRAGNGDDWLYLEHGEGRALYVVARVIGAASDEAVKQALAKMGVALSDGAAVVREER